MKKEYTFKYVMSSRNYTFLSEKNQKKNREIQNSLISELVVGSGEQDK